MMKNNYHTCPECKTTEMVMGLKTGNIHVFGCIKCKNAQGQHFTAKEAKIAWKKYIDNFDNKDGVTK